ncbi:alpha-soluble NSF attachment protein-like [Zingiber officinale]|uniref:alpha-soluble NSF attachment protein-like n=1 Tax=Zingiber officinale TaxID=94328 RepID=UPI001C4AA702|nr:alpha-soluble NSF attachment protein-like [Zingiber officinale]
MADQNSKGEDFVQKAEKKLSGWGIFGSKYDDAADLYEKACNCFKLAKNCTSFAFFLSIPSLPIWIRMFYRIFMFVQINQFSDHSSCEYSVQNQERIRNRSCQHLKLESKHEAASSYVDAANCYKKISIQDATESLNQAVNIFLEIGRLNMAARYCKDLGELYEQEQNPEKAIEYFERAADLFQSEEVTTSANQCNQKVAQLAAQLEQYPKAIEIYEAIAKHSINNNLLKYSVKGILLNAGICQLCKGDVVAITNALERYQEIDPTFSGSRECKLLSALADSMDEEDVGKFTEALHEYDSMTRLDAWKTTLLLRVKNAIKQKEEEEDDLT